MQAKLFTIKDYFEYFNFHEYGKECGIETELESGEYYLSAQTFLPKDFFDLDNLSLILNPSLRQQIEDIPDQVHVKFELFGIGKLDGIEAFIFKPWLLNVYNPFFCKLLEGFHLFIPSTLFYNLVENQIFLEKIDPSGFKHIRILQDIPSNTFQRFGLDRANVPKVFKSGKLEISRIEEVDRSEISKFYAENWDSITTQLENKYFRPLYNTWFRITSEETSSQFLELKQSTIRKTVGFLRLYNNNNSFTGGTSIEYIIDKAFRRKGYATQASLALIDYLKNYSYAISLGAEVNDNNEFSKRELKKLGFSERKSGPFQSDNFELTLFDNIITLEQNFNNENIKISIVDKYYDKYSKYF